MLCPGGAGLLGNTTHDAVRGEGAPLLWVTPTEDAFSLSELNLKGLDQFVLSIGGPYISSTIFLSLYVVSSMGGIKLKFGEGEINLKGLTVGDGGATPSLV